MPDAQGMNAKTEIGKKSKTRRSAVNGLNLILIGVLKIAVQLCNQSQRNSTDLILWPIVEEVHWKFD
jgi:hypothetical protein